MFFDAVQYLDNFEVYAAGDEVIHLVPLWGAIYLTIWNMINESFFVIVIKANNWWQHRVFNANNHNSELETLFP